MPAFYNRHMPLFLANFFASGGKPPFFRNAFSDFQVGQSITKMFEIIFNNELSFTPQTQVHLFDFFN